MADCLWFIIVYHIAWRHRCRHNHEASWANGVEHGRTTISWFLTKNPGHVMAIPWLFLWSYHIPQGTAQGALKLDNSTFSKAPGAHFDSRKGGNMGSLTTLKMLFFGGTWCFYIFGFQESIVCEIFCSPRETFTNQVGLILFRRAVDFHVLVGLGR